MNRLNVSDPTEGWRIAPDDGAWVLHQPTDRLVCPGALVADGKPLWHGAVCALGDLTDALGIPRTVRGKHKGGVLLLTAEGYLPFGAQPLFHHTGRVSPGLLRVTTDLRLHGGTHLRHQVAIGSLALPAGWRRWRMLQADDAGRPHLSAWQPLTEALSWPAAPLAIVLEREDGWQLETGFGSDLWRWQEGIGGAAYPGAVTLGPGADGGWLLQRLTDRFAEEFTPEPRAYRFSWYAAWRSPAPAPTLPVDVRPAPIGSDGGLDLAALHGHDEATPLLIDLAAMAWPPSLRNSYGTALPCLSANGTTTRLRHLVRQCEALGGSFPICFRGMVPACCQTGSHLERRGEAAHWDINASIDFAAWTRQRLGTERHIWLEAGDLDCPSLLNCFAPAAIDYR